jgi:hypothetical protein
MNCFVIMPFAAEFDDVYIAIKSSVESAGNPEQRRCFRLDESRPAGRITDRLLAELRSASLCVADVTGVKPNIMWELGFAMALGKPTIVITQDAKTIPFDLKDMQAIEYDRGRLGATLGTPLRRSIDDTIARVINAKEGPPAQFTNDAQTLGDLLSEVASLKEMVREVVGAWKTGDKKQPRTDLSLLSGAWVNSESESHAYVRMIRNEPVAAYCFGGNSALTGIYFGFRRIGEYLFGRYQWVGSSTAGFTFLRSSGPNTLRGAWWSSDEGVLGAEVPPQSAGMPSTWVRQPHAKTPRWAESCLDQIANQGLESFFARVAKE